MQELEKIIKQIHDTPYKFFATLSGAGGSFVSEFLKYSGASKNLLGFYIPYSKELFDEFTGVKMENYSSISASRILAVKSFEKAKKICKEEFAIGIGAACSIATEGERIGRLHKLNIAFHKFNETKYFSITLNPTRTREEEEKICLEILIKMLALACNVKCSLNTYFANTETLKEEGYICISEIVDLFNGKLSHIQFSNYNIPNKLEVFYSGSFNPIHEAHIAILNKAYKVLNKEIGFELSLSNVDKPPMDFIDINNRTNSLSKFGRVLITNSPKYIDKIKVIKKYNPSIKEIIFIVGIDTWDRIFDEKYYSNFDEYSDFKNCLIDNKVHFLIFPRNGRNYADIQSNRRFIHFSNNLVDLDMMDISSSQIRKLQNI